MNYTDEQKARIRQIREATNNIRAANRDARFRRELAKAQLIHEKTTDLTPIINERAADYEFQLATLQQERRGR